MNNKPGIVLHLEPVVEMYDENNIIDWLAKEFHNKRGYLQNYYTKLLQLSKEEKIDMIAARRTYLGNLNDESYSLIVWRPKK